MIEDELKRRQLEAVATYRNAVRALAARVSMFAETVEGSSDDELISDCGFLAETSEGVPAESWFGDLVRGMASARKYIAALRLLAFMLAEEKQR